MNTIRIHIIAAALAILLMASPAAAQETTPALPECSTIEECQEQNQAFRDYLISMGINPSEALQKSPLEIAESQATPASQGSIKTHTPGDLAGFDPMPVTSSQLTLFYTEASCGNQDAMRTYVEQKIQAGVKVNIEDLYNIIGNTPMYNQDYDITITYNQLREHFILSDKQIYNTDDAYYKTWLTVADQSNFLDHEEGLTPCSPTYWANYGGGK